ncbi:hypothetical protein niasHT_018316 [Heterodera trifolii]|uniref:Integrase catalytic domain-containing protein n=1 Tax=Heterodera trifolii TaxID=157864 RepID=A0ABD2LFS6_9BILA
MKRHSWLYKQRHQLKDMIENKPQKVIVEHATGTAPQNIAPYMGIQKPTLNRIEEVDGKDGRKINKKIRRKSVHASRMQTPNGASYGEETDTSVLETDLRLSKKRQQKFLELKTGPEHYDKLQEMIERNPEKYGVDKSSGEILTNFKKPVIRSNYIDSLMYLTGQRVDVPKGHRFFVQKVGNDPEMAKFFHSQRGEGGSKRSKRKKFVLVKASAIKTVGLSRMEQPNNTQRIQKVLTEAKRRNPSITLRDVDHFLHKQRTYTLFKPRKNRFRRLKTVPSGLHTDWQCDLCIMDALKEHNDGFRYILVCIDVLSRKIFTAEAESKKKPVCCPTSFTAMQGLSFRQRKWWDYWKQKEIIKHVMYSPHLHAGVVERANRTLKERLYKYFSEKNTKRWVDVLDSIVRNLNNSANRTTGLRPTDVNFKNAAALQNRLYKQGESSRKTPKFKVGDIVRISKEKGEFSKGYFPNFTDELFRISKVNPTDPPSYRIRDQDGEDIKGIFYEQELVRRLQKQRIELKC